MNASSRKGPRHLTIRNVPLDLARALETEKRQRARSLNQTVIDLLRIALGLAPSGPRTNGLEKWAGGWSESDLKTFERATAVFEQVDEDLWR